jgi:hypothetical protein
VIALLFALAASCFVLSLPIATTKLGAKLRQAAGVCLVLALLPSLVAGLFFPPQSGQADGGSPGASPSAADQLAASLSCFGAVVFLSLGAYAVLSVRKRFRKPKKEPWELLFSRGGGKKRVRADADDDPLDDLEAW